MKTLRRSALPLLGMIAATLLWGCHTQKEDSPTSPVKTEETTRVKDNYTGTAKTGGQTAPMTMTNTQSGSTVTGTYSIGAPINESGTVSGSFFGLIYNFTLTRTAPTPATFSSSVDVSNGTTRLVGSFAHGLYTYDLTGQ